MFPTGNPAFTSPSQNNPDNSVNLAALYLHPSLGISNQAYTQFYQQLQAQGQAQLAQHQQLQRHFEQLVAVRAAQNAHAQLQAFQQQQAFQNQQVQVQSQQKLHAAHQQNQAQAVHMQRFNALRQSGQHLPHSHAIRDAAVAVAGSRQELQVEVDARRRRSLIADFMIAPNSTPFLDGRGRSDSINSNIMGETRKSEAVPNEFVVITDETTERKKNSITDRLEAVEKEKKLVDNQITIIQRKKEEYESELAKISNDNEDNDKENDDIAEDIDSMSLVERIYAENRKKTVRSEAHIPLSLAPISGTVPQYRNPWDSPLLKETIERYKTVKPFLVKMLTESRQNELLAQKYYADKYNIMYAEWLKKDEKYCKSQKKIARDEKHREIFERTFPEIRKAREERERCGRIGMSSEQLEQDEEYKRRRAAAVLPPMMLSSKMRNGPFYEDLNGVVSDALESHNTHIDNFLGKWSDDEKQIFKEQIGIYGKNFAAISEFLDRKDVKDCVLYYYLTKKRQNYKALLGKKRKKPPRSYKPPVMPRLEEIAQKAPQDANDITIVGSRELECCICKTKVNSGSNTGRIITRLTLDASGYDASSANEIDICVCQKCKAKGIKPKTVTRCQIGICHNPRRKVKPTRPMPAKWKLISDEQRLFLMHQMLIPEDILKCCPACHKKISKQLDMIISGELNQEMDAWLKSSSVFWNNDELKTLLDAVESMDIKDWNVVAEKLGNRYSVKQCQEQYEKVCEENVRKELESEDDGSEDDRENSHSNRVAEIKSVTGEIERDPSVESSSTLTPDEVVNQGDCVVLFPTAAKSPSTHLYKPRFRGTAGAASEGPNSSVDNSLFLISSSKKEPEVALAPSPLAHQKSDASASSSEFSNLEDCKAATLTSQSSVVGSALFATLTSSTPDPTSRSSTQIETDKSSQSSISVAKSSTPIATQTLPSTVSNAFRGSITQGTPVMRPLSPSVMRSPSGNDLIADKLKQIQMFSTEAISAGSSLVAGNNILAPSVPSVPTPTLQPNANVAAAAAAFPFLQNPLVAAATAFPNAASDPNISPFTAFYNQFTTLDPTMQYAMTMKLMQQDYERRLAAIRGTFIDQYRQQALGLSLPEQQQLQSNQQQQINALANDQAKYLLWLQIMQQSTNVKLLQQQQQAASQTMNLQRTPTPNTLLSTLATPASVRSAVSSHFSGQQNTEHQQQTKQGIATTVSTNLPGKVATDNTEQQRTNIQTFCTSTTQLYNDFHNAEQMRKEHDENARQMEAQQKRLEEIRYIEQQRRRVLEVKFETLEEARINDELSRISQIDYPRALRSQDSEAVRSSLQAIERLKERRTAMQHYLRAYDEGLKSLSTRSGAVCSGPSGVIVKGASDERIMTTAGLVSKGAVKEFPPSVSRNSMQQSSTSNISSQGLIGIKRTLNDSALAVTIEGRPSASSLSPATSEANVTSRRSRADSIGCRKGLESNMFDSGQASLMYRSNSHNITDDELSRGDQRNIQSGGEMRRKSGIHTVYLPSLPDVHHTINAKTAAGQKLGNSQTVTGASRHSSSISHSQSFASSSLSRPSLSQQLHHFPHFIPALPQHQARFSTPQSISTPGNISSHVLPSSTVFGCPVVGPANYSSGVHTSASTFISPRTPVSINLNLTISHPAHAPLHNASNITIPAPVASSPFQVSVLEPPSNTFLLTIANSLKFQPLVTADSSSPKFQPSILVPGSTLSVSATSSTTTTSVETTDTTTKVKVENEERTVSVESQQRSESRAFINYEPLSPDTADAVPTTQTDTSTEEASNLPLFSFLNLPDNGNGALSTSTIQPAVSSLNDSQLNARQTPTASMILPQLPTAVSTGIVVSGSTMLPSKPPPQPTYEPLSDDD